MYRKQLRRRRAALALLVAASLALLTAYFGEGANGGLHSAQRGVVAVLAPIEEGAHRALKPARDFFGWIDDTLGAKGENERLQSELNELRTRLAAAERATSENRDLKRLVGLRRREGFPDGYGNVTARVITRSPTVWYSTITVDKGRSSGIRPDQAVVTGEGLIGRISTVTAGTAQVTLITDHTSAVSAEVVPSGAAGVIKPQVGNPEDLLLDFIEKGRRVRKGQTIITAGWRSGDLESLFPRGIPVGRVTDASVEERETYQRVHIEPFADLRRVRFVQVLVPASRKSGAAGARAATGAGGGQ